MGISLAADGEQRYRYIISGLVVQSEIRLNGSVPCHSDDRRADVTIRLADVPLELEGAVSSGPTWQFAPPAFLLEIPGVVRFVVIDGREIVVQPAPDIGLDDVAIFLAGTAIAIALHQRGAIVLHASAVTHGDGAFAFSGVSGAGKSTLAALLCVDGGCEMLSDDVAVIGLDVDGASISPDGRRLRLWEDAIDVLNLEGHRGRPVRTMIAKFHVDLPQRQEGDPLPLRAIYILDTLAAGSEPEIELLPHGRAALALDQHSYRRLISQEISGQARRFQQMVQLLDRVPVYLFSRSIAAADNARSIASLKGHWASLA